MQTGRVTQLAALTKAVLFETDCLDCRSCGNIIATVRNRCTLFQRYFSHRYRHCNNCGQTSEKAEAEFYNACSYYSFTSWGRHCFQKLLPIVFALADDIIPKAMGKAIFAKASLSLARCFAKVLDSGFWIWILASGFWLILDSGWFWILDAGFHMLDFGC